MSEFVKLDGEAALATDAAELGSLATQQTFNPDVHVAGTVDGVTRGGGGGQYDAEDARFGNKDSRANFSGLSPA